MKWIIASDIHGSAFCCEKLLSAYETENADRLLLLGDILYHGPRNDLPSVYETKRVAEMLNARRDDIYCVRGNCDSEVDQMVLDFPIMAEYAVICLDGINIFATHGHRFNSLSLPPLHKGDILLHGHTHISACEDHGDYYYLNPGSVSLPKGGTPGGYIVYSGRVFLWKTLDGEVYKTFSLEL